MIVPELVLHVLVSLVSFIDNFLTHFITSSDHQTLEPSNLPSSAQQPALDFENTQLEKNKLLTVSELFPGADLQAIEKSEAEKDLPFKAKTTVEVSRFDQENKSSLIEPKSTEVLDSTYQHAYAGSNDHKEDLVTQVQNFPIPQDNESHMFHHVQKLKDPQSMDKDQAMPNFSLPHGNTSTIPISPAISVQPPESLTLNKGTSSQELTSSTSSKPNLEAPSINPNAESLPHSPADFESVFSRVEQLLKPSPHPASSSSTHFEFKNSNSESLEIYGYSLALMKRVLTKSLTEVARSTDRLALLYALKNLEKCSLLNSQQLEIIQVYVEHFDSLVTKHSFYEQQVGWTNELKSSIEDERKGIAELKACYEDLTSKRSFLSADKEALKKILCEIEEEEDHIRANMEGLYAQLATREGRLKTSINSIPEAVRQQREAEDRASIANDYWAKFRSLFA